MSITLKRRRRLHTSHARFVVYYKKLSAPSLKFLTCQPSEKTYKSSLLSLSSPSSWSQKTIREIWKERNTQQNQYMRRKYIKKRSRVSRMNKISIRRIYRCLNVLIKRSSPFFVWSIHHKHTTINSLSLSFYSCFYYYIQESRMVRTPCCRAEGLKKGAWTQEEDQKLIAHVQLHGEGGWRTLPDKAGMYFFFFNYNFFISFSLHYTVLLIINVFNHFC